MLRLSVLLALAFAAAPVSGASAASLKVEVTDINPYGTIYVEYQGTADVQGTVAIRVWHGATDCPAPADRDAGAPPDFWTDQPVDAGAFLASVGGELGREGRFVVCGYLDQPGAATAAAAPVFAEYAQENGHLVYTRFNGYFSTGNKHDLQFTASCQNAFGFCTDRGVEGRVSVALTPAARRKVGLRSAEILKGPLKPCGMGTGCAMMAFSRTVERKMDAAQTKAEGPSGFGKLLLKARVTFKLTAPLQRTHSALVTFGRGGTIRFSCATSMQKNQCTDGTYGKFLTGDGIDR